MSGVNFKAGDRVLVIGRTSAASRLLDGKICTVKEVFHNIAACRLIEEGEGCGGVWNYEIELVKENNMTFKVGDKVRVKGGDTLSSKKLAGQICTVSDVFSGVFKPFLNLEEEQVGYRGGLWFEEVELAEESELEQLVKKANEGYLAVRELILKYKDVTEVATNGAPFVSNYLSNGTAPTQWRVKQKPSFEPFVVGKSWTVKLDRDFVHIGCQKFNAKDLKCCLESIISHGGRDQIGDVYLIATRKAVRLFSTEHTISWEESERIVAALQKAGIK